MFVFFQHFEATLGSFLVPKAALALSWHLAECHGICNAQAKIHLGW